ncbi:S8 family serine peptidase [Actinomadura flavalba]|uniref:S8 family serine peptidase n=1 Tax=Actinomadura flavalba TaxID=1120938 RepID=UPI00146BD028|nr:S8 family serine peptidase [Actinomadura flavalba]
MTPGVRVGGALTVLTLTAAVAVPLALAPHGDGPAQVRGASANSVLRARADQIREREWHLASLRTNRAWKYSRGAGVTVAVLDTGVDRRHRDLAGRVLTGPDLTGGERRPGTKFWGRHGTSMASIIAGRGNGPGGRNGVIGVAPQSRVLSIRVTWENDDPMRRGGPAARNRDAVAQGIRYATDQGAQVINMSLGGGQLYYEGSAAEEQAIKYAQSKGVVLIASAGNDGAGANRKNFPAAYPGVIAVGALDQRGRVWKDSSRRAYVAVCAPGVEIVSADAGGGYVVGTGTSPSSAMAAGVAALVRSRYPRLTPDQVRQALVTGAPARPGRPTGSPRCAGPLDAARALAAAARLNRGAGGTPPSPQASSSPAAEEAAPVHDSNTLVYGILGGGGVLVLAGLVLGWRQRHPDAAPSPRPVAVTVGGPPPDDATPLAYTAPKPRPAETRPHPPLRTEHTTPKPPSADPRSTQPFHAERGAPEPPPSDPRVAPDELRAEPSPGGKGFAASGPPSGGARVAPDERRVEPSSGDARFAASELPSGDGGVAASELRAEPSSGKGFAGSGSSSGGARVAPDESRGGPSSDGERSAGSGSSSGDVRVASGESRGREDQRVSREGGAGIDGQASGSSAGVPGRSPWSGSGEAVRTARGEGAGAGPSGASSVTESHVQVPAASEDEDFDDESWEAFRRSALAEPAAPEPAARPAWWAAEEPAEDEDEPEYRPPWW